MSRIIFSFECAPQTSSGVHEAGLHRARGNVESDRHLGDAHAFQMEQGHGSPLACRQGLNCRSQATDLAARVDLEFGRRKLWLSGEFTRQLPALFQGADATGALPRDDAIGPGGEGAFILQLRESAGDLDPGRLSDVGGFVGVARKSPRVRNQSPAPPTGQLLEG
jgi:hypothetical protein